MDSASPLSPPTQTDESQAAPNLEPAPCSPLSSADRAEQVRQALEARRREALPSAITKELVVRNDHSCQEGLFAVVEECLAQNITEEKLWSMGDDAQPIFFGFQAYRLGGSLADMAAKWYRILIAVLRNKGSDPLGFAP